MQWLSENGFAKEKINNGHKADEVGRLEKKALACVYGEEKHQYLRPVHDAFSIALFLRFTPLGLFTHTQCFKIAQKSHFQHLLFCDFSSIIFNLFFEEKSMLSKLENL